MQAIHLDVHRLDPARRPTALDLLAAGLLLATVVLHVVAMAPQYFGGSGEGSLWSQPDQAALYSVLAAGWALSLGLGLTGPARSGLSAGLALGVAATELGFRLVDLGEVFRYGTGQAAAGLWLMTAAWIVGAAGAVLAVLAARRRFAAGDGDSEPVSSPVLKSASPSDAIAIAAWDPQPETGSPTGWGPQPEREATTGWGPQPDRAATTVWGPQPNTEATTAWGPQPDPTSAALWGPHPDSDSSSADSTRVIPVDSTGVIPVDSTAVVPVDSTAVVPVDSTDVIPVDSTAVVPVDLTALVPAGRTALFPVGASTVVPTGATTSVSALGAGPTILVILLALMTAGAFLPAWDQYGGTTAAGRSVGFNLGNAFTGPWQVVIGNVMAALALVTVPILAVRLRHRAIGAAMVAGSLIVLATQFTAAVVQVDEPVPAAAAGLHLTLTGWFTFDVLAAFALFVVAMVLGFVRETTVQASSAATWPTAPEARSAASLPWS